MYSPGSLQISTIFPCSTISMHWPSATAITEPLEMMFSSPFVLDERLLVFFLPLTASTSAGRDSQ